MDYEWVRIQEEPICIDDEVERMKEAHQGNWIPMSFEQVSNKTYQGQPLSSIVYEYFPGMAEQKLSEIRNRVLQCHDVIEVSIVQRVGRIQPGEAYLIIIIGIKDKNTRDAVLALLSCIEGWEHLPVIWKRYETVAGQTFVVEHP